MIRIENETYEPITIHLSSIEVESLLMSLNPTDFRPGILRESAYAVQARIQNAKDYAIDREKKREDIIKRKLSREPRKIEVAYIANDL